LHNAKLILLEGDDTDCVHKYLATTQHVRNRLTHTDSFYGISKGCIETVNGCLATSFDAGYSSLTVHRESGQPLQTRVSVQTI
jgi:hypothetical protein